MNDKEKLLLARINDLFDMCDKYAAPRFSDFLDGAMQCIVSENIKGNYGYNTMWFGGFEDSERKIFGVFPEWEDADKLQFPITVVKISHTFGEPLSHRDYLGSVLALGIDRSKTGDILVDGNDAFVFATNDIAEYIKDSIKKIGNRGVSIEICSLEDIVIPERKFEPINVVGASVRLDAVVAAALNVSRNAASTAVTGGKVSVNHRMCEDGAYTLSVGDLISVRGFGRMILDEVGNKTRKGRQHLVLKKFV